MEAGSPSGDALQAADKLAEAAQAFVDEAQSVANAGVDTAQQISGDVIHVALGAIEAALAGIKHLVAQA